MKKGFQIVKTIFEKFPALPAKLSNLFGKSDVWYRSHSYALRRDDALNNGNMSAVDHILRMADEYEAAAPGAGLMLSEELAAEFRARFKSECPAASDREIRQTLNKEFFEAMCELDKKDLCDQSAVELSKVDAELSEIETAIGDARAHVRAQIRIKQAKNQ